jgi:hypothetical protein
MNSGHTSTAYFVCKKLWISRVLLPVRGQTQNGFINAFPPPLVLADQLRRERPLTVVRDLNREIAVVGANGFGRRAVARIAAVAPGCRVFLITEMMRQFALQGVLNKGFAQVFQQLFNFACRLAFSQELLQ